ncbi:MAG: Zn-dependent hydrolase [Saonia sp.]
MFSKHALKLAGLYCILCHTFQAQSLETDVMVNQERLENSIMELAKFGQKENGETSRVAFSEADVAARTWVIDLMKNAGLDVSIDFAGNIIGRKKGKDASKKPIVFGSHIDTVPDGGNYDGCVGSMGAIEVAYTLNEHGILTDHPLEIIIFSNEEGGVMGSRALVGELGEDAMSVVNSTGHRMDEGIKILGGDASRIKEVVRQKGDMAAFLELHIEQGGILDREKLQIGIVEGIVGLQWWNVEFTGFANHAGTTPMDIRQDALLAAAKFIVAVNEITNSYEGKQVGTVGRIHAEPGAPNVIPGKVILSLEIRDLSSEKIAMLFKDMKQRADQIAKDSNVRVSISPIDATAKPALTDPYIQRKIVDTAKKLKFSYKHMPSGAGHDAQDMALLVPTGMIFVPSRGGISHSPKEFTSPEDMANGTNVLLHTILMLDVDLKE